MASPLINSQDNQSQTEDTTADMQIKHSKYLKESV